MCLFKNKTKGVDERQGRSKKRMGRCLDGKRGGLTPKKISISARQDEKWEADPPEGKRHVCRTGYPKKKGLNSRAKTRRKKGH